MHNCVTLLLEFWDAWNAVIPLLSFWRCMHIFFTFWSHLISFCKDGSFLSTLLKSFPLNLRGSGMSWYKCISVVQCSVGHRLRWKRVLWEKCLNVLRMNLLAWGKVSFGQTTCLWTALLCEPQAMMQCGLKKSASPDCHGVDEMIFFDRRKYCVHASTPCMYVLWSEKYSIARWVFVIYLWVYRWIRTRCECSTLHAKLRAGVEVR
jgi:hypothetical protein